MRPFAPPVPTRQVSFVFGRDQLRGSIADAICSTLVSCLPEGLDGGESADGDWTIVPLK